MGYDYSWYTDWYSRANIPVDYLEVIVIKSIGDTKPQILTITKHGVIMINNEDGSSEIYGDGNVRLKMAK